MNWLKNWIYGNQVPLSKKDPQARYASDSLSFAKQHSKQNTITTETNSNTLWARGLAAIQNQKLALAEQDKRYRHARDIYSRITDYSQESRFK